MYAFICANLSRQTLKNDSLARKIIYMHNVVTIQIYNLYSLFLWQTGDHDLTIVNKKATLPQQLLKFKMEIWKAAN